MLLLIKKAFTRVFGLENGWFGSGPCEGLAGAWQRPEVKFFLKLFLNNSAPDKKLAGKPDGRTSFWKAQLERRSKRRLLPGGLW
jgi:hypothetical protein